MDKTAAKRIVALLAGAAAAASFSAPAAAQSFSKTDAILGGQPSALLAIMAQQGGVAVTARPTLQPASYSRPALQPVSYSRPQIIPAILRVRSDVSPGVANGRPDIFGSVALRVGHTRLDARWQRVAHSPVGGPAAKFAAGLRGKDSVERLEAVNWYVNKRVHFVDDSVQYGRPDVWAAASQTLARGRGDCEDFAIAKLQMLRRAGVSDRDLYLVIVKDLVRRADHAVLVVRAAGHMYVLDSGTDRLLDSETVNDYRPILTFAANGSWTHGYRVDQPTVNIASAETRAPQPAADVADQRSRRASLLAFNTGLSK
jgi:predicted transglutaminase-like cysteine proteinase